MTTNGENIVLAQALFAILYLLNLTIVLMLYSSVARVSTNYHDVTYLTTSYLHMHMLSHTYIHVSHSLSNSLPIYCCSWHVQHIVFIQYLYYECSMIQWPCFSFIVHYSSWYITNGYLLPSSSGLSTSSLSLYFLHIIFLFKPRAIFEVQSIYYV